MERFDNVTLVYLYDLCGNRIKVLERDMEKLQSWASSDLPRERLVARLATSQEEFSCLGEFRNILISEIARRNRPALCDLDSYK